MTAIIDYGAGNPRSIINMLDHLGHYAELIDDPKKIDDADRLILPGVGHFDYGMNQLHSRDMVEALNRAVIKSGKPILGICLGAQLLTTGSEEGQVPGLGWIDCETVAFRRDLLSPELKIPHMGWADTQWRHHDNFVISEEDQRYYFVHSFHIRCECEENILCETTHGYKFVSGIIKDNVLGVQFHPEKSHRFGMKVLSEFMKLS